PGLERDLAGAERDRQGRAANDAAAVLRQLPPEPHHWFVHPRRRGHQRDGRRGDDHRSRRLSARRPLVIHVTTTDISLALLLGPQLVAFREAGYDVAGASAL